MNELLIGADMCTACTETRDGVFFIFCKRTNLTIDPWNMPTSFWLPQRGDFRQCKIFILREWANVNINSQHLTPLKTFQTEQCRSTIFMQVILFNCKVKIHFQTHSNATACSFISRLCNNYFYYPSMNIMNECGRWIFTM